MHCQCDHKHKQNSTSEPPGFPGSEVSKPAPGHCDAKGDDGSSEHDLSRDLVQLGADSCSTASFMEFSGGELHECWVPCGLT
jgi:hypothetical protein